MLWRNTCKFYISSWNINHIFSNYVCYSFIVSHPANCSRGGATSKERINFCTNLCMCILKFSKYVLLCRSGWPSLKLLIWLSSGTLNHNEMSLNLSLKIGAFWKNTKLIRMTSAAYRKRSPIFNWPIITQSLYWGMAKW